MGSAVKFLKDFDKLKTLYRMSYNGNETGPENAAEYSWHLALALFSLSGFYKSNLVSVFSFSSIIPDSLSSILCAPHANRNLS